MDERILRSAKLKNLHTNTKWYRIQNVATGPTQVHIFDEIGFPGVSAQGFAADLADVKGDIEVHINSQGGQVFDGIAIYNTLKARTGQVSVIVDGIAASAASFIAQAASPGRLGISSPAQMMVHNAMAYCEGNPQDMRDMAELLDRMSNSIAGIYASRSGKPTDYYRALMDKETWLNGQEAVSEGLADYVVSKDITNEVEAATITNKVEPEVINAEKYSTDDRKQMASSGEAMEDGSYPIADEEDLSNAIHAVGRGGADHNAIRAHIIKRAKTLGKSDMIPDNWNSDGSMDTSNSIDVSVLSALFTGALKGGQHD